MRLTRALPALTSFLVDGDPGLFRAIPDRIVRRDLEALVLTKHVVDFGARGTHGLRTLSGIGPAARIELFDQIQNLIALGIRTVPRSGNRYEFLRTRVEEVLLSQ